MFKEEKAMTEAKEETFDTTTLHYLGLVLDVLLDPEKKIVDDTSLQRLLEYCKAIFRHKDICKEEDGLKHVFEFFEACCVRDPQDFDPSALTFALQLVRCLSTNQELLSRLTSTCSDQTNSEGGQGEDLLVRMLKRASSEDFFSDPCMKEAWLSALHTLSSIESFWKICIQADVLHVAVDLLQDTSMFVVKSAQRFLARMLTIQYRQDSLKTAESQAQEPKKPGGCNTSSSKELLQEGRQDESSKMMDQKSLVQVRQAAGSVQVILEGSPQNESRKMADQECPAKDELDTSSTQGLQDGSSVMADGKTLVHDGQDASSSRVTLHESPRDESGKMEDQECPVQDERNMLINGDDGGGDGGQTLKRNVDEVDVDEETLSGVTKKSRQSATCDGDPRTIELEVLQICERLMDTKEAASIFASLQLDLQTSDNHKQSVLGFSQQSDYELKTVRSLGVFRCILHDSSEGENRSTGLHLLRAVSMATRCRQILCQDGQCSDKLCEDLVEFIGCFLVEESKMDLEGKPALTLEIQSLPYELIKKGFVKSAIHLSYSIVKLCSILSYRSELDVLSVMKTALSVILGPVSVIMEQSPLKTDLTLDHDVLHELREKIVGRQAATIVCTALSTLGDMVKEGCCPSSLPACQIFHQAGALLHACTPSAKKTIQSKCLTDDFRSLIGSRKVMTSLLDLIHGSLSGACLSADIWLLVDLIHTILKNPNAEYQTVLKLLPIIPDLIPIAVATEEHPVSIENTKRDALLMEVGYDLQKRMCNIEWEVRDSAISCVGKLLQNKSDTVRHWLKRNNLHLRLWESLADSESYVRSTTLQSLPVLMSCKELWVDVLSGAHVTLVEVVSKVTEVIKSDSEAFPRRAAIGCLLTWLQNEQWMRDSFDAVITKGNSDTLLAQSSSALSLPSPSLQDSGIGEVQDDLVVSPQDRGTAVSRSTLACTDEEIDPAAQDLISLEGIKTAEEGCATKGEVICDAVSEATGVCSETKPSLSNSDSGPQEQKKPESAVRDELMTLGDIVLDAVSIATCDFDWEMKLLALEFYLLLSNRYVPGYDGARASSSVKSVCVLPSRKIEELCEEGEMKVVVRFFSGTGCLAKVLQGSRDEDVSVARKACEMLHALKVALGELVKESESVLTTFQENRTDGSVGSSETDQCCENEQTRSAYSVTLDASESDTPTTCTQGTSEDTYNGKVVGQSMCVLIGQLFEVDWIDLLNHREADNVEGPVSLMMDILAAADEKEENLLDCY